MLKAIPKVSSPKSVSGKAYRGGPFGAPSKTGHVVSGGDSKMNGYKSGPKAPAKKAV